MEKSMYGLLRMIMMVSCIAFTSAGYAMVAEVSDEDYQVLKRAIQDARKNGYWTPTSSELDHEFLFATSNSKSARLWDKWRYVMDQYPSYRVFHARQQERERRIRALKEIIAGRSLERCTYSRSPRSDNPYANRGVPARENKAVTDGWDDDDEDEDCYVFEETPDGKVSLRLVQADTP